MTFDIVEATAPSHWANYFFNGDSEGMEEGEEAAADLFAQWLGGPPVSYEEAGFLNWPDSRLLGFFPYAADCFTFSALIKKAES